MQIDASDVITNLTSELANTLQRAIIAETQVKALEKKIEEQENGS